MGDHTRTGEALQALFWARLDLPKCRTCGFSSVHEFSDGKEIPFTEIGVACCPVMNYEKGVQAFLRSPLEAHRFQGVSLLLMSAPFFLVKHRG